MVQVNKSGEWEMLKDLLVEVKEGTENYLMSIDLEYEQTEEFLVENEEQVFEILNKKLLPEEKNLVKKYINKLDGLISQRAIIDYVAGVLDSRDIINKLSKENVFSYQMYIVIKYISQLLIE